MTMTDRDKKILLVIAPLLVLIAYWFLLLAPKRDDATEASAQLSKQEARLATAEKASDQLNAAQTDFAADYTELVKLGKAVPTSVDMPTLIVQLETAARGTGLRFTRIAAGERAQTATAAAPADTAKAPGTGDGSQPAAAGGEQAQSGPGKAAEAAGNAVNTSNSASSGNQAAAQSGVNNADTQTSTSSKSGGLPVGGGATPASGTGTGSSTIAGLDTVPLELEFRGGFFQLADFFHRLKRFVRLVNEDVVVHGRLMSVDSLKFSSDPQIFPSLKAEIKATVYLAPKDEGATAGATPQGPESVQASDSASPSATTPPTAVATP